MMPGETQKLFLEEILVEFSSWRNCIKSLYPIWHSPVQIVLNKSIFLWKIVILKYHRPLNYDQNMLKLPFLRSVCTKTKN